MPTLRDRPKRRKLIQLCNFVFLLKLNPRSICVSFRNGLRGGKRHHQVGKWAVFN